MRHLLEIAQTGLASVWLHRLRSLVCVAALVAVLLPFLVGLGLAKGIETEAEASAQFGADLYVTGRQFGRPVPVPLAAVDGIRRLDAVTAVKPRIVGEVVLGKAGEHAVLVGLPPEQFAAWADCIDGAVPRAGHGQELVFGSLLARRLGLHVGSIIPPISHSRQGDRTPLVVGIFKPDAPLWQARLILATFETAAAVFDQPGLATDLLVTCRPSYQSAVSRAIQDLSWTAADGTLIKPRATSREELVAVLPHGVLNREGILTLHFVLIFAAAILVLLVASGLGLAERRREIGILKATGWQTDEVLLRAWRRAWRWPWWPPASLCSSPGSGCGCSTATGLPLISWLVPAPSRSLRSRSA